MPLKMLAAGRASREHPAELAARVQQRESRTVSEELACLDVLQRGRDVSEPKKVRALAAAARRRRGIAFLRPDFLPKVSISPREGL